MALRDPLIDLRGTKLGELIKDPSDPFWFELERLLLDAYNEGFDDAITYRT